MAGSVEQRALGDTLSTRAELPFPTAAAPAERSVLAVELQMLQELPG